MATRIAIMDKGVIQQVGTPDDIYNQPENLFVADFVGAPAMNMVDSDICVKGKKVTAPITGSALMLNLARYRWRTPAVHGQKVTIGFRAEHVSSGDKAPGGAKQAFRLPVQFVETSGPDAIAFLQFAGALRPIAMRIDPAQVKKFQVGAIVPVNLPIEKINIFDAHTGRRL